MFPLEIPLVIAVPTLIVVVAVILYIIFLRRRRNFRKLRCQSEPASVHRRPRRFDWFEHPPLVSAAVENGWAGFAFAASAFDSGARGFTETGWEIGPGSKDLMQSVSLYPWFKDGGVRSIASVRTVLPLPGPPLGPFSFPREAYWEVTVLPSRQTGGRQRLSPLDGERIELMPNGSRSDRRKVLATDDEDNEDVMWLGMTAGALLDFGFPGETPGSIGFSSTGVVYLDGKIFHEHHGGEIYHGSDKKMVWGGPNSVVGCGFDPSGRQLYFTVDSVLVRTIQCESDIYSNPLYPTLAANFAVTVLVNLGQSQFRYEPPNIHRMPDPCLAQPGATSPKGSSVIMANTGIEDSGELFSMGRIDPHWMRRNMRRESGKFGSGSDADESGFFEIVLDPRTQSRSMP